VSAGQAWSLFLEGVAAYQAGQHYEAHEFWEELWNEEPDEERSRFLQALIQVASAVHKARNDVAPRGSLRLLDRAAQRLEGISDDYLGMDVASLREGMQRCHAEVAKQIADKDGHCELGETHIPALRRLAESPEQMWPRHKRPQAVPDAARSAWFERGLAAYQRGEHFEAHELWEEIWRDAPRDPERQFLQGLIQVAAAMHKAIAMNHPRPAARLLARALLRLTDHPDTHWGLQLARLIREAERAKTELAQLGRDGHDATAFDRAHIPTIARIIDAAPAQA
jgi:predicted metal-dependent hydrolase